METQTTALFGDITLLAKQMQEAIGQDASSMEEVMQRVQVPTCPALATTINVATPTFCWEPMFWKRQAVIAKW